MDERCAAGVPVLGKDENSCGLPQTALKLYSRKEGVSTYRRGVRTEESPLARKTSGGTRNLKRRCKTM
jgi:hypothetical protein